MQITRTGKWNIVNNNTSVKKKTYDPFLWVGFNCLKAAEPLRGDSLFLTANSQEFLVIIWSTSEEWKAELTLESAIEFEQMPRLGIKRPNHWVIASI